MRLSVKPLDVSSSKLDTLIVPAFAETNLDQVTLDVDASMVGSLSAVISAGDFEAKKNEVLVLYPPDKLPAQRVIVVGLGKRASCTLDTIRQAAGTAIKAARKLGAKEVAVTLPGPDADMDITKVAEATVEGCILAHYRFLELKSDTKNDRPDVEHLTLVVPTDADLAKLSNAAQTGKVIADSTALARDLVNRPANIATPSYTAEVAHQVAEETDLRYKCLTKDALAELGMNVFLSVNQGGDEPAQLIILEHNPGRDDLPTIVLVGKGITFDSGGLSLKPSAGMQTMKCDMGGAAAVIGAMRAVALLNLPLRVVGLAPVTENMPDSKATKPGDVFVSRKGLTVEVLNTDAEGRLILADALTYAGEFNPDAILDIATLTGGRIVALGDHASAVMGDDTLAEKLHCAGHVTGERTWQLPLWEDYGEGMKSDIADLRNIASDRGASSITAAYFLSRFVPEGVPWAHIDIAGLAMSSKDKGYITKGATGYGVRLFVETLRNWENKA